jgi:hypothetical protein
MTFHIFRPPSLETRIQRKIQELEHVRLDALITLEVIDAQLKVLHQQLPREKGEKQPPSIQVR